MVENMCGDITQIAKWHAMIDIDRKEQVREIAWFSGVCYRDANNLYGGVLYRMMPYELVGIPQRQEVMEKINRNPERWI